MTIPDEEIEKYIRQAKAELRRLEKEADMIFADKHALKILCNRCVEMGEEILRRANP